LNWEKSYSSIRAYSQSKTSNILFTLELAERLKSDTFSFFLFANRKQSC